MVSSDCRHQRGAAPSDLMQVLEAGAPSLLCFLVPAGFLQLGLTGSRKPEAEVRKGADMLLEKCIYRGAFIDISCLQRDQIWILISLSHVSIPSTVTGEKSLFGE